MALRVVDAGNALAPRATQHSNKCHSKSDHRAGRHDEPRSVAPAASVTCRGHIATASAAADAVAAAHPVGPEFDWKRMHSTTLGRVWSTPESDHRWHTERAKPTVGETVGETSGER